MVLRDFLKNKGGAEIGIKVKTFWLDFIRGDLMRNSNLEENIKLILEELDLIFENEFNRTFENEKFQSNNNSECNSPEKKKDEICEKYLTNKEEELVECDNSQNSNTSSSFRKHRFSLTPKGVNEKGTPRSFFISPESSLPLQKKTSKVTRQMTQNLYGPGLGNGNGNGNGSTTPSSNTFKIFQNTPQTNSKPVCLKISNEKKTENINLNKEDTSMLSVRFY